MFLLWIICGLIDPEPVAALSPNSSKSDLALVLAVDASSSIDETEFKLQLHGIANAFRQPEVLNAVRSGPIGKIDVAVLFWAGQMPNPISSAWFRIGDETEAERFASHISAMTRRVGGETSVGSAVMAALALLGEAASGTNRLCIDLSGDGRETVVPHSNRRPTAPSSARAAAESLNVTINALAIESEDKDLAKWFRRHAVTGDGFVMAIDDSDAFGDAIQHKLIREIRQPVFAGFLPKHRQECSGADNRSVCHAEDSMVPPLDFLTLFKPNPNVR
jgi:hypothetical protein